MVISLMVAFVILILSTVVVAQSIHTLDSSGYDRRRLTSVNAAEAGTNFYYQYFQTTPGGLAELLADHATVGLGARDLVVHGDADLLRRGRRRR